MVTQQHLNPYIPAVMLHAMSSINKSRNSDGQSVVHIARTMENPQAITIMRDTVRPRGYLRKVLPEGIVDHITQFTPEHNDRTKRRCSIL